VRTSVFEFVTKAYEKFTHILFSESRSSQDKTDGFNIYEPTYIPEGFRLVSKSTGNLVLLEYENENDFISYSQQYLENISIVTNTKGVELEELEFKGFPARYYSNKGVQNNNSGKTELWLGVSGISIITTDYNIVQDIIAGNMLDNKLIKASMQYLGIDEPQVTSEVQYNKKDEPYEYRHTIIEMTDDIFKNTLNNSFKFFHLPSEVFAQEDIYSLAKSGKVLAVEILNFDNNDIITPIIAK
jgi:hypothetical protein